MVECLWPPPRRDIGANAGARSPSAQCDLTLRSSFRRMRRDGRDFGLQPIKASPPARPHPRLPPGRGRDPWFSDGPPRQGRRDSRRDRLYGRAEIGLSRVIPSIYRSTDLGGEPPFPDLPLAGRFPDLFCSRASPAVLYNRVLIPYSRSGARHPRHGAQAR